MLEVLDLVAVVVVLGFELVDGPCDIGGVECVAVGEIHVLVELEGVGQPVVADGPAFRETGFDLVVRVARDERFVHVADEQLFERRPGLVADVEAHGREFDADGDAV